MNVTASTNQLFSGAFYEQTDRLAVSGQLIL
jgi:hypothetical protein